MADAEKAGVLPGPGERPLDEVVRERDAGRNAVVAGVEVVQGRARFDGNRSLSIEGGSVGGVDFRQAVIATGSSVIELPAAVGLPVWTSTEALQVPSVPERLLVVGGGYIGLELGLVYAGLGSEVSVVEFLPRLLMGADPDLVKVMTKHAETRLSMVMSASKVVGLEQAGSGFRVNIEHEGKTEAHEYDQVRRLLETLIPDEVKRIYLHGDVCRSDLLTEVDGIVACD